MNARRNLQAILLILCLCGIGSGLLTRVQADKMLLVMEGGHHTLVTEFKPSLWGGYRVETTVAADYCGRPYESQMFLADSELQDFVKACELGHFRASTTSERGQARVWVSYKPSGQARRDYRGAAEENPTCWRAALALEKRLGNGGYFAGEGPSLRRGRQGHVN